MIGRVLPTGRTAGAEGDYTNSLMTTYIKRNYYTATSLLVVLLSFWKVAQRLALHYNFYSLNLPTIGVCKVNASFDWYW